MKVTQYEHQSYRENLAADLKMQRELKGYTQVEVARAIDVTTRTISRIEDANYDSSIKLKTLHEFAKFVEWPCTVRIGNYKGEV